MKVLIAPALLLLATAACHNAPARPAFDYSANLGVAVEKSGHACLYLIHGQLSPGQRVQLVTSAPQTIGAAEVLGKAGEECKDPAHSDAGTARYSFKVTDGKLRSGAPAIAIANFKGQLAATADGVTADLDGDGQPVSFRACTSAEGVHLTAWKGKPLTGVRKWHEYYQLGYDVTPDCTESDTKPD